MADDTRPDHVPPNLSAQREAMFTARRHQHCALGGVLQSLKHLSAHDRVVTLIHALEIVRGERE